jgi:hypothetical protein
LKNLLDGLGTVEEIIFEFLKKILKIETNSITEIDEMAVVPITRAQSSPEYDAELRGPERIQHDETELRRRGSSGNSGNRRPR